MSGIFSFGQSNGVASDFMAFAIDEVSLLALRGWAEKQGYPQNAVTQGTADMFAEALQSAAPPKMAIVDIDGHDDPAAATVRLVSLCGTDCKLIILGSANDVTLYRRILGAGAVDYLVKPLSSEILAQALSAARRGATGGRHEAKEARIITFIGARGGVGASTIALNVGWMLAHQLSRSTVLLDLDLQFGTSSLALDLEPGRGLRDIVGSPHRVDALMIASSLVPESDLFSVLGAEEAVDELIQMDSTAITSLLKEMKSKFDAVIVDLPRSLLAAQKRLLAASHEIVLVSDMTLAGIRDTLRIKNAILSLGGDAPISIVASRTNAAGAGQIERATFEKGVQGKIDAVIVEDAVTITAAANSGKALGTSAPRASITRALRDLAVMLGKVEEKPPEKKSFLNKLIGRKKAPQAKGSDGKNKA